MIKPYYHQDGITIYNADCRDVLPRLEPVDLVLTDPPYGIGAAAWDAEVPLWALPLIKGALVTGGSCYWFGVAPNIWTVALAGILDFQRELVWHHQTGYPAINNFRLATETILFLSKGDVAYFNADAIREPYAPRPERPQGRPERQNPKGKSPGNVLVYPRPAVNHTSESGHQHSKPIALLKHLLKVSCPETGIVLDPFMGGGATLRAAQDFGLRAIGIENEKTSCDLAIKCLRQPSLLAMA